MNSNNVPSNASNNYMMAFSKDAILDIPGSKGQQKKMNDDVSPPHSSKHELIQFGGGVA